jgi:hypothetical protein
MITYYAKLNQTGTPIRATLTGADSQPIELTGTVHFVMWNATTGEIKINSAATIEGANAGEVSYQWGVNDLNAPGYYLAEWRIVQADGKKITVPTDFLPDSYIKIIVGEFEADSYISTLQLMSGASAPEASDEQIWTDYAVGASRLFDRLCEVEAGFFNQAQPYVDENNDGTSEKIFYGNDIDMLQLPPYVGAIEAENILIDDEEIEDDFRLVNGFLINRENDFDVDSVIKITARWGFASVPADVQMIVRELAVYCWRAKDPHFSRISDTGIYEDLSPLVKNTIKKFREKYSQLGAV